MNASTAQDDDFEITIDDSTAYQVNAGHCERCGYYKTWGFRVQNPKSGKMMPGHVTQEGFKINNGDCPYWTKLRGRRNGQANTRQKTMATVKKATPGQIGFSRQNGKVTMTIKGPQPVRIDLDKDELLKVLLDAFTLLVNKN